MFTKQETFDRVARHLLTQNEESNGFLSDGEAETLTCLYRSGLLKCAAGCLIPEEEYKEEYEGKDVKLLCSKYDWSYFFGHDIELVSFLQTIHDTYHPNEWRGRLKILGELEGLDVAVLNFN